MTRYDIVDAVATGIRQMRRDRSRQPFVAGLDGLSASGAELYRAEARAAIHAYNAAFEASGWVCIQPPIARVNEHDRKIT